MSALIFANLFLDLDGGSLWRPRQFLQFFIVGFQLGFVVFEVRFVLIDLGLIFISGVLGIQGVGVRDIHRPSKLRHRVPGLFLLC